MKSAPVVPPGGQFPTPTNSSTPLLALRCSPALRPYLPEDATTPSDPSSVAIIIDTPITFSYITGAAPVTLPSSSPSAAGVLDVTVTVNGKTLANGSVPLNSTGNTLPFSLSSLQPQQGAYNITCSGTFSSQSFQTTASLTYLPAPPSSIGSVTKTDLRTGALLARPADGKGGDYESVFPIGFYTQFNGYLANNLSVLGDLKAQGCVPPH